MIGVADILRMDFGHVVIDRGVLICLYCGERCEDLLEPRRLHDHLYLISGFVGVHEACINKKSPGAE